MNIMGKYLISLIMLMFSQLLVYGQEALPVLYIDTENSEEITSKEVYLNGNCRLEWQDGLVEEPLQIKGRGNVTWNNFEKKPYRLKFTNKVSLLGMKKNKHFVLLSGVDDQYGFLKYAVAFELSRRIGLEWTPTFIPIELYINNDYRGLYFLTENIRIDKNRVNIEEQDDCETDPDRITGGWLLEIDNYNDSEQVSVMDGNGSNLRVTYHSPEILSVEQENYLISFLGNCVSAIYTTDKNNNEWENLIDIHSLAKFYIVHEVLDNIEAFCGSCYMYKDRGIDTKLKFGPIWDLSTVYTPRHDSSEFIYVNNPYVFHWIDEIAKFPHFQEIVRQEWYTFKKHLDLDDFETEFQSKLRGAVERNAERWPTEYGTKDLAKGRENFDSKRDIKIAFLNNQWSTIKNITAHVDDKGNYWATYYDGTTSFTADDNTMVYQAALNGDKVALTEVKDKEIPANQAVILKSSVADISLMSAETTSTLDSNQLLGTDDATLAPENAYCLTIGAYGIGFYKFTGTIPAHRAYIVINTSAPSFLDFSEGDTAGTKSIPVLSSSDEDSFYNLIGRRVVNPSQKGIYIKNRKKIIIK